MTNPEDKNSPSMGVEDLAGSDNSPPSPLLAKIAALEDRLSAEQDGRMEDRFIGLVVFFIFFDILALGQSPNVFLPVAVLILELVILLLLAKRMGSEEIARLFDRLLHSVTRSKSGGGED